MRKKGFECGNATGCSIGPYRLLSPTVASRDLVDSRWLNFPYFSLKSSTGTLRTIFQPLQDNPKGFFKIETRKG